MLPDKLAHSSILLISMSLPVLLSMFARCLFNFQVEPVTEAIDTSYLHGRVELVLTLAQVYRLLRAMRAQLPQLAPRPALFSEIVRSNGTTVQFLAASVRKTISNWDVYCIDHDADVDAIQVAYSIAREAASRLDDKNTPFLNTAIAGPHLKKGVYTVETGPLGHQPVNVVSVRVSSDMPHIYTVLYSYLDSTLTAKYILCYYSSIDLCKRSI
jgi:hypothetical protein